MLDRSPNMKLLSDNFGSLNLRINEEQKNPMEEHFPTIGFGAWDFANEIVKEYRREDLTGPDFHTQTAMAAAKVAYGDLRAHAEVVCRACGGYGHIPDTCPTLA